MEAGDIPLWLDGPPDFDRADPNTPIFDSYWAVLGMGKHSDRDGNGIADQADDEAHLSVIQSEVFHSAGPEDWTSDDELESMRERGELVRWSP